jgi:hypothetical protein
MSAKIKKLAVLICGELRSWNRASDYIFAFAEDNALQVDYYFATWADTRDFWWPEEHSISSTRKVDPAEITSKFVDRNLINYKIINQAVLPRHDITFYYQSYLAKIANTLKRRHEFDNNFVYDQVMELRPDLYKPHSTTYNAMVMCNEFEYLIGTIYDSDIISFPQIGDFYNRANSFTNDVIGNRFYYTNSVKMSKFNNTLTYWPTQMNNHWVLLDYLLARRLASMVDNSNRLSEEISVVIRPNFPKDNLRNYSIEQLQEYTNEWIQWQWTQGLTTW